MNFDTKKRTVNIVNWSELQPELLELIVKKLNLYIDYVRLRAVCVDWRSYVPPTPQHLPSQLPWLMLQNVFKDENRRDIYDLSRNELYPLNISNSLLPWRHCCGSSLGWLLLLEDRSPVVLLFNPLTRIEIHLPPLTSLPPALDFNIDDVGKEYLVLNSKRTIQYTVRWDHCFYINKFVLSSSPTSLNEDYIVVAIIGLYGELAFCKKGDEEWTMIKDTDRYYDDVIYSKGLFYAVNRKDSITVCDVSGLSPVVSIIATEPRPTFSLYEKRYLVDSFGELLLVNRKFCRVGDDDHLRFFKTVKFEVFKLDSSRSEWSEWVQVTTLGDRMLFLGLNSSLCLLASDFSGFKGNTVYFIGGYGFRDTLHWTDDSGVFNLEDNSSKALPNCTDLERLISPKIVDGQEILLLPPSVWITPNPY